MRFILIFRIFFFLFAFIYQSFHLFALNFNYQQRFVLAFMYFLFSLAVSGIQVSMYIELCIVYTYVLLFIYIIILFVFLFEKYSVKKFNFIFSCWTFLFLSDSVSRHIKLRIVTLKIEKCYKLFFLFQFIF